MTPSRPQTRLPARRHRAAAAVALCAALALPGCGGADIETVSAVVAPAGARGRVDTVSLAHAIHERINNVRAAHGLGALAWNPALVAPASAHSVDMATRDYFSHNSPEGETFADRYRAAGFTCRVPITANRYATGGENLALSHLYDGVRTYSDGRSERFGWRGVDGIARRVVEGWMQSPGHRANILKPFWRSEAIGVAIDSRGQVLATQNFC